MERVTEVGVDSFAGALTDDGTDGGLGTSAALRLLVDRVAHAEAAGLDVFGVGEHHHPEFLDSAPAVILAAAAARTRRIRLTSAVTVLAAVDPVRAFQQFATLDLLSAGRAEMVVGRGSFTEAFPLFGIPLAEYDARFAEHLELLLALRSDEHPHWSGRFRPALTGQGVYPRPVQNPLPVWLGVGGSPASFVRAGALGLPLMLAVIGGETRRFRPLVDLYREAGRQAGHAPERLRVGLHALGFVGDTSRAARDAAWPGYARTFAARGAERGWRAPSRAGYDAQLGPDGALLIGAPDEVADKIARHAEALGGVDRVTLQLDVAQRPHAELLRAIELLGDRVAPAVRGAGRHHPSHPQETPMQTPTHTPAHTPLPDARPTLVAAEG